MATQSSAWYVAFFRDDYVNVYGHLFTEARAEKEAAFVANALELTPKARLLDLCCGPGRHSIVLARCGFQVTALDLNSDYLELACRAAQQANVTLETVNADMREIPFEDY